MQNSLDKLIKLITKHFVFDEKTYPELKGMNKEERLAFAIRHSALHFAKTAGKVAAVSEDADHGDEIDVQELKKNIPKAFINALRLAELVDMSASDIIRAIEEKYGEKVDAVE